MGGVEEHRLVSGGRGSAGPAIRSSVRFWGAHCLAGLATFSAHPRPCNSKTCKPPPCTARMPCQRQAAVHVNAPVPRVCAAHRHRRAGSVSACLPAQPASDLFPSAVCISMGRGAPPTCRRRAGASPPPHQACPGSARAPVRATSRLISRAQRPELTGGIVTIDKVHSGIDGCRASRGIDGSAARVEHLGIGRLRHRLIIRGCANGRDGHRRGTWPWAR